MTQKSIDAVCKYRGLPSEIRKGMACEVNGWAGTIWGGNTSANFNVKRKSDSRVYNCHPGYRMKIMADNGSIIYRSEDAS